MMLAGIHDLEGHTTAMVHNASHKMKATLMMGKNKQSYIDTFTVLLFFWTLYTDYENRIFPSVHQRKIVSFFTANSMK